MFAEVAVELGEALANTPVTDVPIYFEFMLSSEQLRRPNSKDLKRPVIKVDMANYIYIKSDAIPMAELVSVKQLLTAMLLRPELPYSVVDVGFYDHNFKFHPVSEALTPEPVTVSLVGDIYTNLQLPTEALHRLHLALGTKSLSSSTSSSSSTSKTPSILTSTSTSTSSPTPLPSPISTLTIPTHSKGAKLEGDAMLANRQVWTQIAKQSHRHYQGRPHDFSLKILGTADNPQIITDLWEYGYYVDIRCTENYKPLVLVKLSELDEDRNNLYTEALYLYHQDRPGWNDLLVSLLNKQLRLDEWNTNYYLSDINPAFALRQQRDILLKYGVFYNVQWWWKAGHNLAEQYRETTEPHGFPSQWFSDDDVRKFLTRYPFPSYTQPIDLGVLFDISEELGIKLLLSTSYLPTITSGQVGLDVLTRYVTSSELFPLGKVKLLKIISMLNTDINWLQFTGIHPTVDRYIQSRLISKFKDSTDELPTAQLLKKNKLLVVSPLTVHISDLRSDLFKIPVIVVDNTNWVDQPYVIHYHYFEAEQVGPHCVLRESFRFKEKKTKKYDEEAVLWIFGEYEYLFVDTSLLKYSTLVEPVSDSDSDDE